MKKIAIRVAVAGMVLIIAGVILLVLFLDGMIKKGVETVGPSLTQTTLRLDGVSLSLLGGSASLRGLHVGNPQGYKGPTALEADHISVKLSPSSLFSDKVVIHSLRLDAATINVEGSPNDNNLTKILANVQSAVPSSQSTQPSGTSAGKKLQVDDLVISNTKVNLAFPLLGGKGTTVALPDIHLTGLGQGPEGISPAALVQQVMTEVTGSVTSVATVALKSLGGVVTDTVKDLGKGAVDGIEKAGKGIKDLFKKKP